MLRKQDPARMATVLYVTAEVLRAVGILAQPFVPDAAAKAAGSAGSPGSRSPCWRRSARLIGSSPAPRLPQPQPIFPRYLEPEAA